MINQHIDFRWFVVIFAWVSLFFLWWVSWQAWNRWDDKVTSQKDIISLKQKAIDYSKLESEYEGYIKYQMNKAKLVAQLQEKQLLAQNWDLRNVRVNSEELPRAKIQNYLAGLAKESNFLFVPAGLVIATLNTEESIFSWNPGDVESLRFSLDGDYYMRRNQ